MATRMNVDYGFDIQKLYLELFLIDAESFVRCQSIFDHTLFDSKLQNAAEFIASYVDEYNAIPTYEIVNATTRCGLDRPPDIKQAHLDWLMTDFETFIRHKGLARAVSKSIDLLEDGDYGAMEELIKQASQVSLQKDLGTDYFANPKERLNKIKSNNGQISTGWKALDHVIYGGFNRGELNLFGAQSGGGKSLFLANLAVNWALTGMNCVYVTLELSEELVSMRIDSMVTGVPTREIFKSIDDIDLRVRMIGKNSGSLAVKFMPSGKNTNDIRAYLKEYEIKTSQKVDVILVDYIDLMMPNSKKISAENLNVKDKFVSEELRNLAVEKNACIVSAVQFNRSGVDEVEFTHANIAGGISKIQTCDNMFGIFTSRAMRERGRYQLQCLKTRNSSGVGSKIEMDFNVDTLRINDLDEDAASPTSGGTSFLQSIKNRTSAGNGQSTESQEQPKVKAKIESTRLRELINNLPDDEF